MIFLRNLLFHDLGELREAGGIVDSHVSQDLAVHLYAGVLKPIHETAVGKTMHTSRGVDADDPKPAVLALLLLASRICRGKGSLLRPCPTITLRELQYAVMFLPCVHATFYSCHLFSLLSRLIRQKLPDNAKIRFIQGSCLTQITFTLCGLLGKDMALEGFHSHELACSGLFDALCGSSFCLGFQLLH